MFTLKQFSLVKRDQQNIYKISALFKEVFSRYIQVEWGAEGVESKLLRKAGEKD